MMLRFLAVRAASLVAVLASLVVVLFILEQVSPVDPVRARLGANADVEIVERERGRLGYDDPLPAQLGRQLAGVAQGDLGESLRTRNPVAADLAATLPASVELGFATLLLAGALGGLLGVTTAAGTRGSGWLRILLLGAASIPVFVLAMGGLILWYRQLGWLPATGRSSLVGTTGPTGLLVADGLLHGRFDVVADALRHLALPAVCLAVGPAVAIGRVLRGSLVDTLEQDHIRTARSKGLGERRVLARHALRGSLGPTLSMAGLQTGLLLAFLVIVEQIFAWPGVGNYLAQSIPASDFPAVRGVTLLLGAVYIAANAGVDVLQARADPRVLLR